MLEPNPLVNLPDLEQVEWNYDQSVQKMRQLVVKWKTLSLELLRELYLARMNLSAQGNRSDVTGEKVGWSQYLLDIGSIQPDFYLHDRISSCVQDITL